MANYGSDVSRTLDAVWRQFNTVVMRKGNPPCDAELNLMEQMDWEALREIVRSMMPSGFLLDPTMPVSDYQFDSSWSNMFVLGNPKIRVMGQTSYIESNPVVWANVNGWLIPVVGTDITPSWLTAHGEPTNIIRLNPPPESDARVDFVFLEAWQARIDANPAIANKPSKDKIWKYGNVKFGGTNLADDLTDPRLGYQTSARVQIQYRIRVFGAGAGQGQSADLITYPDGLGNPLILGQAAAASPVPGFYFTNMREEMGDPSLWRAGNGNPANGMGTIDGYSWAIPICAVFRRNSRTYLAIAPSGNPNHNGAFSRTPGTNLMPDPLVGARILATATVTGVGDHAGILASDGFSPAGFPVNPGPADIPFPYGYPVIFSIKAEGLVGSGLDDPHNWPTTYIVIDNEVFGVTAVDTINGTITIPEGGRGRFDSAVTGHAAGTVIKFFNTRPDGLFSDQITATDVLDLRRGVNAMDWDFGRLLEHNVAGLMTGRLRTAWKREGASYGGTQGPVIHEVDELYAYNATHPNGTEPIDGPDGCRYIWSDAAAIQPEVTCLLDNEANTSGPTPQTVESFDASVEWDVAPGFKPSGFLNTANMSNAATFTNGAVLLFHIGGETGGEGARGTFRDGNTRAVRFLMPKEMWKSGYPVVDPNNGNQHPIKLRFLGQRAFEPPPDNLASDRAARHVGPMYPWKDLSFEYPFIALGGILKAGQNLMMGTTSASNIVAADPSTYDTGIFTGAVLNLDLGTYDFDNNGDFGAWEETSPTGTKRWTNDPALVTYPLLRGERTLFGLLTDNGRDLTGLSSEVYLVIYGDKSFRHNNGAFQVIGAGTVGYTTNSGATATSLILRPLSSDFSFTAGSVATVMVEFRTPYHNADDASSSTDRVADLALVLTDVGGQLSQTFTVGGMMVSNGDHPWKRNYLGALDANYNLSIPLDSGTAYAVDGKALVDLTLVYHPGRGAMDRVPDELVRFALRGSESYSPTGQYLRENKTNIDPTFPTTSGVPSNEIWWNPVHAQLWNRLPGQGWPAPTATNYGGNVVGYTEQDRESELFYDRGSKTAIFRPFRYRQMTLRGVSIGIGNPVSATAFPANTNLEGSDHYLTPWTGWAKDGGNIFTAGKYSTYPVPYEFMPRFGRQDIPYYTDINSGNGPFLCGINHLFVDTTNVNSNLFNIIGGEPELSTIKTLIFRTDHPELYGQYGTYTGIENERPVMYARKTTSINVPPTTYGPEVLANLAKVNSSDFGKGLKGIQLPPYIGPARVLGVYEKHDFESLGGHTFKGNRWQMEEAAPPNLLRTDADKQTLFILQDGAKDWTGETDDHTYIIPSNAIDLTRSLYYMEGGHGTQFQDFEYVVELTVFGFAKGFINKNNYVLIRRLNGHGGTNVDTTVYEFDDMVMCIPCPAGDSHHLYSAYNRTVYQGDPYFTVTGDAADYSTRYGQVSISHQYDLRTPIQQYDANGNYVPQIVNPKAFEVLASMDFYTTMGTGKIGGDLYAGTPLDIGFTGDSQAESYRMPAAATSPEWRIEPRAFTEGQKSNPSRGRMTLACKDSDDWSKIIPLTTNNQYIRFRFNLLDGTNVDIFGSLTALVARLTDPAIGVSGDSIFTIPPGDTPAAIANLVTCINNHPLLYKSVKALTEGGDDAFTIISVPVGSEGTGITVATALVVLNNTPAVIPPEKSAQQFIYPLDAIPSNLSPQPFIASTTSPLVGGVDFPLNAGDGTSQVSLTGMTERLPLGALLQDSDFLCENPLNDHASAVKTGPAGPRPIQTLMPMTQGGEEFERFIGAPGQLLALSDGFPCISTFSAWTSTDEGGSRIFRIYRGGGAPFVLSGDNPGGPVDWVSDTFPPSSLPVLKGGVLACRAMLVRNYPEQYGVTPVYPSAGDEIQMLVVTYGHLGDGRSQVEGVTLDGIISPAGYGEGMAAADRYRINGRPMFRGFTRQTPDPNTVQLAVYPDNLRTPEEH